MSESPVFTVGGYADENRDATRALEATLRTNLDSGDIVCTYNGLSRTVSIYLGDELDSKKRQLVMEIGYQLNVALDIVGITQAVVEAAGAMTRRNSASALSPKDATGA